MNDLLADTHAAIWYLFEPGKLSAPASKAFKDTESAGKEILVSAISLIEIRFLIEKFKLSTVIETDFWSILNDPSEAMDIVPVSGEIAAALGGIPRNLVPDMPDRIIAATALYLKLPLVTCDPNIQKVPITTIW